jgi:hypothetical protein
MKDFPTYAALVGVFLCLGFVGSLDVEDAEASARHYSEMVCAGHWPDYENRRPNCEQLNREGMQ